MGDRLLLDGAHPCGPRGVALPRRRARPAARRPAWRPPRGRHSAAATRRAPRRRTRAPSPGQQSHIEHCTTSFNDLFIIQQWMLSTNSPIIATETKSCRCLGFSRTLVLLRVPPAVVSSKSLSTRRDGYIECRVNQSVTTHNDEKRFAKSLCQVFA